MKSKTPLTDAIAHAGLDSDTYIARMTALARELEVWVTDEKESAARSLCHTGKSGKDHLGQIPEDSFITDSGAISTNAGLLRDLHEAGRFRIVREFGRMVVGFWPENDPERTLPTKTP